MTAATALAARILTEGRSSTPTRCRWSISGLLWTPHLQLVGTDLMFASRTESPPVPPGTLHRPGKAHALEHVSSEWLLAAAGAVSSMHSTETMELLYHANWLPFSPAWSRRFPGSGAVNELVSADSKTAACLRARWTKSTDASWLHFSLRTSATSLSMPFKLYVSVAPVALRAAFPLIVAVLADHGAPTFKFSRTPRNLLRPDRMVVYTGSFSELQNVGSCLVDVIGDLPFQGVPFTAAVLGSPAVSWARDPPPAVRPFAASWRRWVAKKLAAYLHASDASTADGRVAFALERLQQDGVDVGRWCPEETLWSL